LIHPTVLVWILKGVRMAQAPGSVTLLTAVSQMPVLSRLIQRISLNHAKSA
jgi:hypothetical protein